MSDRSYCGPGLWGRRIGTARGLFAGLMLHVQEYYRAWLIRSFSAWGFGRGWRWRGGGGGGYAVRGRLQGGQPDRAGARWQHQR